MAKVNAQLLNVDLVLDKLNNINNVDLTEALGKSAALVEATAKENLISSGKVKSGNLVGSIKYRVLDDSSEVFTTVPYATYVEFGTGMYAEDGNGRPGWWVYVDKSCGAPESKTRNIYTYEEACRIWHILAAKYGEANVHITQGQHPTRFLRNALDSNKDEIVKLLKSTIKGVK